jgi:hypothetical protein
LGFGTGVFGTVLDGLVQAPSDKSGIEAALRVTSGPWRDRDSIAESIESRLRSPNESRLKSRSTLLPQGQRSVSR